MRRSNKKGGKAFGFAAALSLGFLEILQSC
jgi:hypothetical protein